MQQLQVRISAWILRLSSSPTLLRYGYAGQKGFEEQVAQDDCHLNLSKKTCVIVG